MDEIDVACRPDAGGWRCAVALGDAGSGGRYEVTVAREDADRLAAAHDTGTVERLVDETFRFLLEREPASSILRTFDITVVGRYFPEYETEIEQRLAP